jgi:hypothetical protein
MSQSGMDKDMMELLFDEKDNALVTHTVFKERAVVKSDLKSHTRVNHEYHLKKWKRCVYCDNNIPIREEE